MDGACSDRRTPAATPGITRAIVCGLDLSDSHLTATVNLFALNDEQWKNRFGVASAPQEKRAPVWLANEVLERMRLPAQLIIGLKVGYLRKSKIDDGLATRDVYE